MNGFTLFAANEKTFLLLYLYKTLYVKSVLCSEVQHLLKVFHFSIFRVPPELILAAGAWSPPQAHLAFRFFTIYRKFCDPSLKKRFPRKDVNTWPATPPQKSEWSVLFSSSHIFGFFFNLRFVRNFCGYRKFDCTRFMQMQIFQNSQTSKIGDFENLSTLWAKFLNPPIFEVF